MYVCGFYFITARILHVLLFWWRSEVKFIWSFAYWALIEPFSWPSYGSWSWRAKIAVELGIKICLKPHDSLKQNVLCFSWAHFVLFFFIFLFLCPVPCISGDTRPLWLENASAPFIFLTNLFILPYQKLGRLYDTEYAVDICTVTCFNFVFSLGLQNHLLH